MNKLEIDHLTKRYYVERDGRQVLALSDVSLSVAEGEFVALVGPSGCGKTTLLRVIAGLERLDGGSVALNGAPVTADRRIMVPPHHRRLGFVFQDLALWPHLSAAGNVDFALGALKLSRAERTRRVHAALSLVQIEQLSKRFPHELSGGEQQRLALARAIAGEPRVLLLDEPLSSLDADLRAVLRAELGRLRQRLKLTMVYVTHDRADAAVLANQVIEMRAGRVVGMRQERV
jgi:iron(III) transport system ATP-binding protein